MKRWFVALAVATLTISPLAAAGYGMKGSYEPDTQRDTADGFMFPNPDVVPITGTTQTGNPHKVYFNGFVVEGDVELVGPINLGLASERVSPSWHSYQQYVMMGVWKDCNNDGYVGLGDNGLWEYRAELLAGFAAGATICRPQPVPTTTSPPSPNPPFNWFPVHNDGEWVHEFVSIQWSRALGESIGDANPWNLNDNASRVWADNALPEDPPRGSCQITPQPTGTFHSVGGLLWYGDCFAGYRGTDTLNSVLVGAGADNLGLGQLSFKDKPRNQYESASVLNVKNPWGEEKDSAYVEVWNCDGTPGSQPVHHKVSNDTDVNVSAPRTSVPTFNPSGSPSGTANSTGAGFDGCSRNTKNDGHSHWGRSAARLPYGTEGGINSILKIDPDNTFAPMDHTRPAAPLAGRLGKGTPPDGGTNNLWQGGGTNLDPSGIWRSNTGWTATPWVSRADLAPAKVFNFTYYGKVSPAAIASYSLTLAKPGGGVYGTVPCGGVIGLNAPTKNNWVCDPTKWHFDTEGRDTEPRSTFLGDGEQASKNGVRIGARVGDVYNLRDIDCFDQSTKTLRQNNVHYGLATGTKCNMAP